MKIGEALVRVKRSKSQNVKREEDFSKRQSSLRFSLRQGYGLTRWRAKVNSEHGVARQRSSTF